MLKLSTPLYELHLHEIPRVAMKTAQKLAQGAAGAVSSAADPRSVTVDDLIHYLPMRYEDRSNLTSVRNLQNGMWATIDVSVRVAGTYPVKGGKLRIFEISGTDSTGQIRAFWWNQGYLQTSFKQGRRVLLYGQWKRNRRGFFEVENPDHEFVLDDDDSDPIHTGRRVPIYRKLGEIRTKQLRSIMHHVLARLDFSQIRETIPEEVLTRGELIGKTESIKQVHFPAEDAPLEAYNNFKSPAHRRLIFEEFFWMSLAMGLRREGREQARKGTTIEVNDRVRNAVRAILPFKPTGAQKRVLAEIVSDMTGSKPMNRLLQGDVGSGKTIVAVQAAIVAIENSYQAAIMAPTEILAEQHARNIKRMVAKAPYRVELLTGSLAVARKRKLHADIEAGEIDLVIGTHALIQEAVKFHKLGFVVIDEQHRFGVLQRAELMKRGYNPDVLVMTATPIPRSLVMSAYGDLDLSIIDEMPPGRKSIVTRVRGEESRRKMYKFLDEKIRAGAQVYIVYPLVEESEKLDLLNATQMAEHLQSSVFPNFRVGLIHGRMKQEEKDSVMDEFRDGAINILVSTTVIEVGVDVPNASIMIVEHAERFGLSQLHQLRGRVGRGDEQSYCILLAGDKRSPEARERLAIMEETNDGFKIAEKDLEIRGPGEVMGTRQSGEAQFRVGNIVRDYDLLELAKREADRMLTARRNSRETARLIQLTRQQRKFGLAAVG